MDDTPEITCPVCAMTSHHPKDVEHGWCGKCHDYTANPDGCVRAYLRTEGTDPTLPLVMAVLKGWFAEREPHDKIIDWLPDNWARYSQV